MKYIFFLILFLITLKAVDFSTLEPIYVADFEKFDTEFEPFQSSSSAESKPEVIKEGSDSVLYFSGIPTKYSGYITSDWISSESGGFYILIQFKGELDLRTGGYIGYMRDDQLNIQRTIGLDANINMDFFQIYRFNTTGQWNTYIAYVKVTPGVKIKIILEKGNYFGLTENRDAKFRNLKIYDFELCQEDECPAIDEDQKILQLGYYTFVFFNNQLEYKIFADVGLRGRPKVQNEGTITVKYPHPPDCCVKAAFYMRDATGGIIEDFNPIYSRDIDFNNLLYNDEWKFDFTMSEIEDFKCTQTATTTNTGASAVLHTCDMELHFYYDYAMTFNTHKDEFDYSSKNSQGIFRSQFYIVVSKQDQTIFNTYVQTLEIDAICTGICQLDFEMKLDLFYAMNPNGPYTNADTTIATPKTLIWGDYLSFKITSNPSTYNLELMKIIVETSDKKQSTFGSVFIDSYIQNVQATEGELYFEMRISGEAGLEEGKPFFLQFLTKSTTRRLLEDEEELPKAQISGQSGFIAVKSSMQLALGFLSSLLFLLILF